MDMSEHAKAAVADPDTRSRAYRLLAEPFRYPTVAFFERLRDGAYAAELREALAELAHARLSEAEWQALADGLSRALAGCAFEDYESLYITTFDAGAPQPPCPPYEGSYRDGVPKAKVLLHLAGFYKHFGLRMSTEEGKRELPDHIAAELEFMHFLAFKEAQAREVDDGALLQGYVLAQRDFLSRHLCRWMPRFVQALKAARPASAFALLAEAAHDFFQKDLALVQGYLKDMGIAEAPAPPTRETIPIVAQDDTAPPGAEPDAGHVDR